MIGEERPVLDVPSASCRAVRRPTVAALVPTYSPTRDSPARITRRSRVASTLRIGEFTIWWTRLTGAGRPGSSAKTARDRKLKCTSPDRIVTVAGGSGAGCSRGVATSWTRSIMAR